jgi:hypothetical protein
MGNRLYSKFTALGGPEHLVAPFCLSRLNGIAPDSPARTKRAALKRLPL